MVDRGNRRDLNKYLTLNEKHEYLLQDNKSLELIKIDASKFDSDKPLVCMVIGCLADLYKNVYVECNGQKKKLSNAGDMCYEKILFELPAGTKEITLSLAGASNSLIAIQKILIYQ